MKKILILLLVLIFISGCNSITSEPRAKKHNKY